MYNTHLCDQNQQSIFSVFRTDLKKSELVMPAWPSTPRELKNNSGISLWTVSSYSLFFAL